MLLPFVYLPFLWGVTACYSLKFRFAGRVRVVGRFCQKSAKNRIFWKSGRESRVNTKIEGFALSSPCTQALQVDLKSLDFLGACNFQDFAALAFPDDLSKLAPSQLGVVLAVLILGLCKFFVR